MIRTLNAPVGDLARFASMASKRRLLGMSTSRPSWQLLRETYFDTPDGTLAAHDLHLRLRSEARGRQTIVLTRIEAVSLQGIVDLHASETPVVGGGLYATLREDSEIATRLRTLLDPHALRPRAAVDIDREVRDLKARPFGRATHRVLFDEAIVHAPGIAREVQEVTVVELASGRTSLEELGDRLRSAHGVTSDGLDTYGRIRKSIAVAQGIPRRGAAHDVRVAVLVLRDWEVGLVENDDGLALPTARGSGELLARDFLRGLHDSDLGTTVDLDLAGFAAPRGGGVDLEVWVHELAGADRPSGFVWIPLLELMERLGGPRLRDPGLLASMLMLVRSETGHRLLREALRRADVPRTIPVEPRSKDRPPGDGHGDYLDLDLSILDFNQRVLELAEDPTVPLLERFRFLSIFASNLDEFFVVRVGRLKDVVAKGGSSGGDLTAEQLLDLVAVRVRALRARQDACLTRQLLPALAEHGIRLLSWADLDEKQRSALTGLFSSDLFPLVTPLSMTSGPGRSFPRLESLGLALAVAMRRGEGDEPSLGYLPIPGDLDRFVRVPGGNDLIAVEHVIGANAGALFPSARIENVYPFRATRLGDVDVDEDSTGSLLAAVADEVEGRRYLPVIRIEVDANMPREVRAFLVRAIRDDQPTDAPTLTRSDVYDVHGPLDLTALSELERLDVPEGTFPTYHAHSPLDPDRSIFEILRGGDVLCHHPFHDFERTVGRFLTEASVDPDVVSIKLTLYRTGRHSPVMDALLAALEAGKDVSVFVELKARFDEASNIRWTHLLKEAGARVVYGVVGYKTHAKTALVVRREGGGVRRYVHIGTGNYNAATARFYTDFGLMSADPDLGADLNDFFNELTGGAGPPQQTFRRLLVAPHSLARGIDRMIAREVDHARAGRPARIQAKLNGLADRGVVRSLYRASLEGVEIDLVVRSICTLRPGVPGLSENIRVRSILGRYLEHSRVYYFENAGQSEFYIGSADWRGRNLHRRVEVVTPVDDPVARQVLRTVLDVQLDDPRAWALRPDGVFERLDGEGASSQDLLAVHASREGVPSEPEGSDR